MDNSTVVVEDLAVERGGRPALRDISCRVPPGRITGLVGPSGCGKSTLMRCLVGVQRTAGGTVTVLGRPAGHRALRRRIGYATQNPALYADLTVRETLRYFAEVLRAPRDDADRVIGEVGLASHADALVGQLSGGQAGRANLAVALLGTPQLLILDEPTVGLDPVLRQDLWHLFGDLARQGVTLIISSHVMDEAVRCDELLLLREGRLLAGDSPDALRRRTGRDDMEQVFLHLIAEAA